MEDTLTVYQTEMVFYDTTDKHYPCHYRLNAGNIKKIEIGFVLLKKFFGLKKYLGNAIYIYVDDPEIPDILPIYEFNDPGFGKYTSRIRDFAEANKIPFEIIRRDEE